MIYESEVPDITKFTYLRSLLKGEAKVSIQGLTLTNANYTVTIDILKKRLGKTDHIVFSHIEELLNISVPNSLEYQSCGNLMISYRLMSVAWRLWELPANNMGCYYVLLYHLVCLQIYAWNGPMRMKIKRVI